MTATLRIESASRTDKGNVRQLNEDSLLDLPARRLWVVADGMGGHSAGDVASQMIVEALRAVPQEDTPGGLVDAIEDAVAAVNERLYDMSAEKEAGTVIGSTVALLTAFPRHCLVAWMGDSRVYRLRDGRFEQITHDHSAVEEMIADGAITREQARDHASANVVTRAVGGTRQLFLDLELHEVLAGDRFLICSDGLYKDLTEEDLARHLGSGDVEDACAALIKEALGRECRDNITAIVVDFRSADTDADNEATNRTMIAHAQVDATVIPSA